MALSAAQMQEAVIKNLPEKTGKSLDEWIRISKGFNCTKNSDILKRLKSDFGLGHVQAQTIVWRMEGEKPYVETHGYEEAIFKNTFDLYLLLKNKIVGIGDDISVKPCKTYIPFYRKNQFAILTEKKGELILGLNLKDENTHYLQSADKLGGSQRINKMIVVNKDIFHIIEAFLTKAYQLN